MKRTIFILIILCTIKITQAQIPVFTWESGSNIINQPTLIKGFPGARYSSISWTDISGKFWIFGGQGIDKNGAQGSLNDLWKFEPDNGKWTWEGGSDEINQTGNYGTKATGSITNIPGARYASISWVDASGNLWLFGGYGYDKNGVAGRLNDLWKFNPGTKEWTWISGSNIIDQAGVYGIKGTGSVNNFPGGRQNSVSWMDLSGNLWIFSGFGADKNGTETVLNDLWKYSPGTGEWTWEAGSDIVSQPGVYGTKGTGSVNNIPGARYNSIGWKDSSGNFWLFGGNGNNDLWKYNPSNGEWTWMGGSNVVLQSGVYGTKGIGSVNNIPGWRGELKGWTDAFGNFWLFGGRGENNAFKNDLWKYDPSSGEWTWEGGSDIPSQPGVYGSKDIGSVLNIPGARLLPVTCTDTAGNLWLFGGWGYDRNGTSGLLNDLWKYNPGNGEWTWTAGSEIGYPSPAGIYGTKGSGSLNNVPGSRYVSNSWNDTSGNFWLFGGIGYDKNSVSGILNDLWKYNGETAVWTWAGGSDVNSQPGVYGTKGTASINNIPGSRRSSFKWTDASGNLWLFGGSGYDKNSTGGSLNDLWKYNPGNGKWTWISGSDVVNQEGNYGTKGVGSIFNIPGGRFDPINWIDNSGNLWLFGGYGYDENGTLGILSDFWKYNPVTEEWTWIGGSSVINQPGIYGNKGAGSVNNIPGARYESGTWTDTFGNFWLLGGEGYDKNGLAGDLNDLWKYNLGTGEWTWEGGSDIKNQSGIYGLKGIENANSYPGARVGSVSWTDVIGNFWILGGIGFDKNGVEDGLSDFWKYNPRTGKWTWVAGSDVVNQASVFGTQATGSVNNSPGSRRLSINWKDQSGNFWLFGGYGIDTNNNVGYLSDLWKIRFIPGKPEISSANNITQSGFTGTWKEAFANQYHLDVSLNVLFAAKVINDTLISGTGVTLTNLSPGKTYYYRVRAENDLGISDYSDTLSVITVPATPAINPASGISSTSFNLSWPSVNGANGFIIDISSDNFVTCLPGYQNDTITATSISLTGVTSGSAFQARLRSYNNSGASPSSATLNVITLPSDPVALPASSIGQTGFTANWLLVTGAMDYLIEISAQQDFGSFVMRDTVVSNSLVIGALNNGTNYYYRIKARNISGLSGYSNMISTITIPTTPALNAPSGITQTSCVISWPSCTGSDGYLLDASQDNFTTYLPGFHNDTVKNTNMNISGLVSGTSYQLRLRSFNTSGVSPYSSTLATLTIPGDPVALAGSNLRQSGFTASWSAVTGSVDYLVDLSFQSDFSNFIIRDTITILNIDFSNLTHGTVYYYRLRARNSSGISGFSNIISTITIPATPLISASGISQEGFTVAWSSDTGADHYELDLSQENFQSFITGYNQKAVNDTLLVITGLTSGSKYQARVRSVNSSGESPSSDSVIQQIISATPTALQATNILSSSFLARWTEAAGVDHYEMDVSMDVFNSFVSGFQSKPVTGAIEQNVTGLTSGVTYQYRVRSVNNGGTSPNSNVISVVPQGGGQEPLAITNVTFGEFFPEGSTAASITFKVAGGVKPYLVTYEHKPIMEDIYSVSTIEINPDGTAEIAVDDSMMDELGMVFNLKVIDNAFTVVADTGNYIYRSFDATKSPIIPTPLFGGNLESYQIISIPYILEDNLISSIFEPSLGKYDKSKWRLTYYLNSGSGSAGYVDYTAGINRIELGNGYWFNSVSKSEIKTGAAHVNTQIPYPMVLKQGWNEIGNPYNIPVSWNKVLKDNGNPVNIDPVRMYNASSVNFSIGDIIQPFSGGFVWSDVTQTININPKTTKANLRIADTERTEDRMEGKGWKISVRLEKDGMNYELGGFGMHPEGSLLKDRFDEMELPRYLHYLELYTEHKDYFYPWFSTDIVPEAESHSWVFQLESNFIKGPVKLEWTPAAMTGKCYLFDGENGLLVDMMASDDYEFIYDGSRQIQVYYTEGDKFIPEELILGNAYPNPSRGVTTIPVSLPQKDGSYTVKISMYDLSGKEIKQITQGDYAPGYYEFSWDGRDQAGQDVSSGVYICRLELGNTVFRSMQKKIIITR